MCPGRLKSAGCESLEAKAFIVTALSRADTPVVVPCFASYMPTYIVNTHIHL
ncbi:hypothetical protein Hanom_Chr10g00925121 [Helianthus anomalus]